MTSNVYTKNEILQSLSLGENSIDTNTLNEFIEKWHIEAVFEDARGTEFYDENALITIRENILNEQKQKEAQEASKTVNDEQLIQALESESAPSIEADTIQTIEENANKAENEQNTVTDNILNDIKLSDGTLLIDKVGEIQKGNSELDKDNEIEQNQNDVETILPKAPGILAGALGKDLSQETNEILELDDMSLLSESFEAQEKLRQYVVSELSKKNLDVTPKSEFKLDISEKTLNMIARTMAKKIAKYVCELCARDLGTTNVSNSSSNEKTTQLEQDYKKLEQKVHELEDQNRKLRLLLTESNKNLNSYKPGPFGLYKKVKPKTGK